MDNTVEQLPESPQAPGVDSNDNVQEPDSPLPPSAEKDVPDSPHLDPSAFDDNEAEDGDAERDEEKITNWLFDDDQEEEEAPRRKPTKRKSDTDSATPPKKKTKEDCARRR